MKNNLFRPGAMCFDIGASRGESVDRLAAAGAGRIISVEPSVWNYIELLKARERHSQCVPIIAACGKAWDVINVTLATDRPGLTSCDPEHWKGAYPDAKWGQPQPVPVIPLYFLFVKYGIPDFVKIDVEGQEKLVLQGFGAPATIPHVLTYEFHNSFPMDAIECLNLCESLGYRRFCYSDNDIDLEKVPDLGARDFEKKFLSEKPKWGNIVCMS